MAPAATTKDGGKGSQKKSKTNSGSIKNANTKLCHIVKRADFDGYGFNLHTEKSKPGQFIGKVDAKSPAEAAGLRTGYRILEVNGIKINNETHKEVVQRIKAIAWEVKLLVSTDEDLQIKVAVKDKDKEACKEKKIEKSENKKKNDNGKQQHQQQQNGQCAEINSITTATITGNETNKNVMATKNGSTINEKNKIATTTTTAGAGAESIKTSSPPPLPPKIDEIPSTTKNSFDEQRNKTTEQGNALKLPSTAAEMRAILQSKKKFNPKCDEVNLQQKYDIIQKL